MATELRSLAAAALCHHVFGPRPLEGGISGLAALAEGADEHQRARFMMAGLVFGTYYRGSSYVFSGFAGLKTSPLSSHPTTALVTLGPYASSRNPALLLVWCDFALPLSPISEGFLEGF